MKLAFLLLALAVSVGSEEPSIRVELIGDSTTTMPIVTVNDAKGADEVIVRTEYWTDYPGIVTKIVLSRTCVVPAAEGAAIAADNVPVPKDQIRMVHVTLVKDIGAKDFRFKMENLE